MGALHMNRTLRLIFVILALAIVGNLTASAQSGKIDRDEFWNYLRRSQQVTGEISFRETVTVETGDSPDGPWQPYSSWISDGVFPDRTRILYTSRSSREYISIGKVSYSREDVSSPWIKRDKDPTIVGNVAGMFGFTEPVITVDVRDSSTVVKVVSKNKWFGEKGKDTQVNIYSFNAKGALVRSESVAFSGRNWLRRIENYQYDPDIRIEPPINWNQ